MSSTFGVEPEVYKVLVYNQLSSDEIAKAIIDIRKVTFWDITASVPGSTAVDSPHISVYWYGPGVSTEKGRIVHLKTLKLDSKYSEPIRTAVAAKVGGTASEKEGGIEFRDYTMKISYASLVDLSKAMEQAGKVACEATIEYEMVTKQEKANSGLPKTKILGEKAQEK